MDLSLQPNGVITVWDKNDTTGLITVTFYDSTKTNVLGEFIIESDRFRSMVDAMKYIGLMFFPEKDLNLLDGHRTVFDNSRSEGVTKWV